MFDFEKTVKRTVLRGSFDACSDADVCLSTILGSCVAVCLYDDENHIGGMNHYLLPDFGGEGNCEDAIYGAHLMELLINDLLKRGVNKRKLKAKVFGGGRVVDGLSDVGRRNIEFAFDFLKNDGISIECADVGGSLGRRILFRPSTGQVRRSFVKVSEDQAPERRARKVSEANCYEMFR